MQEKNNLLSSCLTSPLAGEDARRAGEGDQRENTLLSPLIGFECLRTQNHFPRGAARRVGSQTAGGFTLIELLVVVLIIGILASVALPQYQVAVAKSRLSQAFVLAKSIKDAEEAYYLANGEYTTDLEALSVGVGNYEEHGNVDNFIKIKLANEYIINVAINGYGNDNNRIEVFVPANGLMHGITYYLDVAGYTKSAKGKHCFGENTTYQQACKSMGGVRDGTVGRGTVFGYELPL